MFDFLINGLMSVPGILVGFVFHEYAHAFVADRLGDKTPRMQGKLTFDPRVHIDWIGFIFILLVGFGWAKPVQINTRNFRKPRRDHILVSLAGPVMNLIVAAVFLLILKLLIATGVLNEYSSLNLNLTIINVFSYSAFINVILFVLNLLPIPFFDGYSILSNLINTWKYRIFAIMEQYSMFVFLILYVTNVFSYIIRTPASFIFSYLQRFIL